MLLEYKLMPSNSKVWVFPSSRKFYKNEIEELNILIPDFLKTWENETKEIDASFKITYNRFIIIIVNVENTDFMTNTIDKLVVFMLSLQERYNVVLIDKMNVCFKQGEFVQYKELKEFKALVKSKGVSKKTIVFDNLIQTKEALENHWEIPITESWYNRFF